MSFANINLGTSAGAGNGDDLRTAFDKINKNFQQVLDGTIKLASTSTVNTVAGRTGNVVLTANDVQGVVGTSQVSAAVVAALSGQNISVLTNNANYINQSQLTTAVTGITGTPPAQLNTLAKIATSLGNNSSFASTINSAVSTIEVKAGLALTIANAVSASLGGVSTATNNSISTLSTGVGNLWANAALQASAIAALQASDAGTAMETEVVALRANVTAANLNIAALQANAQSQAGQINTVNSNIAATNSAISNIQANAAAVLTLIGNTNGNVTAANTAIAALQSNAVSQQSSIALVQAGLTGANIVVAGFTANAHAQEAEITALQYSIAAANVVIVGIESDITSINTQLSSTQSGLDIANLEIGTLQSNVSNLQDEIDANYETLTANATTQQTSIRILTGNVAVMSNVLLAHAAINADQWVSIGGLQANLILANGKISALQNNVTTITTNIRDLQANAGVQADTLLAHGIVNAAQTVSIAGLQANLAAANSTVISTQRLTLDNVSAIGNLQTDIANQQQSIGQINNTLASLPYTPTTSDNWNTAITTIGAALDELAARIHAIEHP